MKAKLLGMAVLSMALTLPVLAQDAPGPNRYNHGPAPMFHGVGGEIVKIEGNTLTLTTLRGETAQVTVGDATRIMKERTEIKLTDLKVGDHVMVRGEQNKDGVWVATGMRVGMPGGPGGQRMNPADNGKTFIAGKVTKIDGLNLTVEKLDGTSQVIAVDDNTSFRNPRRESITLADVKVGDMVHGTGAVKDGVFVAKELTAGARRMGPPSDGGNGMPPEPPNGEKSEGK